jgi:hypothetical protein
MRHKQKHRLLIHVRGHTRSRRYRLTAGHVPASPNPAKEQLGSGELLTREDVSRACQPQICVLSPQYWIKSRQPDIRAFTWHLPRGRQAPDVAATSEPLNRKRMLIVAPVEAVVGSCLHGMTRDSTRRVRHSGRRG